MPPDELVAEVASVIASVLNVSVPITARSTAGDIPGWDSLSNVRVILAIERRFGIRFTSRQIVDLACVGDIAEIIAHRERSP